MPIKKSEIYSSLWKSCDELRGGMDASQYKDYVLVLLFVKYVSDKYGGIKDALVDVPKGGSFQNMVDLKGKAEIGDGINKIIAKLAEANDLKGIIDVADFNDSDKLGKGKDMQDRLSNLIAIFQNDALDFSKNKAEGDDILGDAYEYLMRHFATESGKSKGQFYTPAEVSRVIAKVIGASQTVSKSQTVYDPTCGSGSLLLKVADETPDGITIYGQEIDVATRALAVMNMWLHENPIADIQRENSLSNPLFRNNDGTLKTFDFVVANPPFSTKSWSNGIDSAHDAFGRFDGFGIPPPKNGDYAFLLHIIKSLKNTGKGAVILPHGVLFRGNVEGEIRKNIIKRGYIKGIIGLPPNLFYGTGISACLIVLDKENAENRKGIFMIDASKGFVKDGNKNRLQDRDIHKIVNIFNNQKEISNYSRMVPLTEITNEKNNFNLNIPRYIDSQEEEDLQDIEAHLKGGIPNRDIEALSIYWKVYPNIRQILFRPSERTGYSILLVDPSNINSLIFENTEYKTYLKIVEDTYSQWRMTTLQFLQGIGIGTRPKDVIFKISESILDIFFSLQLIERYDIYQLLMTYWSEIMQDDVYLIAQNGWKVELNPLRNKKEKETGWDCVLIPKHFVINRYFTSQRDNLDVLQRQLENITHQMESINSEAEGEEDPFSDIRNDSGKIIKPELVRKIRFIKDDPEFIEELSVLSNYSDLIDQEIELKAKIKRIENEIDRNLLIKYKNLTEDDLKILVIEDKWINSIYNLVNEEMDNISQKLTSRIIELAERYNEPLPKLSSDIKIITTKVNLHLEKMGFKW